MALIRKVNGNLKIIAPFKIPTSVPDYIFIGYITASNTSANDNQYINLGIKATRNTKIEIKYRVTNNALNVHPAVVGARTSASSNAFCLWSSGVGEKPAINIGNKGAQNINVSALDSDWHIAIFDSTSFSRDSDSITFTQPSTFTTPTNLLLFDINGGETSYGTNVNVKMKGDIAYCKVWENNVLVRNMVPVKKTTNNEYGMVDMLDDTFYGNAGTGNFTGGD